MAIPNDLRQMNRRRLVMAALRRGTASRSDLARETGLSQPTVGKIADELVREQVLVDWDEAADAAAARANGTVGVPTGLTPAGNAAPRLGRPGQLLMLDARRPRFLAVQLGVVHTRMAPLAVAPPPRDEWPVKFATPASLPRWVAAVERHAATVLSRKPAAVLVSVPGVVDESAGRSLLSPNLRWLENTDLRGALRAALGVPVHVVQEIRCLAMGHRVLEGGEFDFLLVDFGNGVGAAAVINGSPYRGPRPLSGELGHTPVDGNDRTCGCGARGCLETIVSRRALIESTVRGRAARRHHADGWAALVDRVTRHGVEPPLAAALSATGRVIAGALNVLGVDRVVVTGSLAELPPAVVDHLRFSVESSALWARLGSVTVQAAPRHRLGGLASIAIDHVIAPE